MSSTARYPVTVLGAGSWGTALSLVLARNGHNVYLWDRNQEHLKVLESDRVNTRFLPGTPFPENIQICFDLGNSVSASKTLIIVVPSTGFRNVVKQLCSLPSSPNSLVWASKGLEPGSGKFLHQVVNEELSNDVVYAALSGPSFAMEVAHGLPTAVTVASDSVSFAETVADLFHCPSFRTYTSNDMIGVELGGSVKNVLAIAAGISDGLGYGANARAALITRGLAEIMRLGTHLGGQRETFMGLAGVGDLVLTCTDDQSRNRRLGLALGRGEAIDQAVEEIGQAVEGLHTARELDALAHKHRVDMPITQQVKRVLFDKASPADAVRSLLARDSKPEVI